MSNLLFFGSGVAKGAGEFLDEKKAAYERQVEFTTRSLREELKAARLARRAKTDAATQRLEELGSLGITGAAAESMLRLSGPLYQTHLTKFMEMGPAPEGLSIREQQERLGFRFDPSMADQKPSTNEEILNRYIGEFPAAAIRPKDEPDFRSGIARAFGFADPEDQAMEQAAESLGISTDQAAALLDDTFEREAYNRSVTLTPVKTEMQILQEQTIRDQAELTKRQRDEAIRQADFLNEKIVEPVELPMLVRGEDGIYRPDVKVFPVGTTRRELQQATDDMTSALTMQKNVFDLFASMQPPDVEKLSSTEINLFDRRFGKDLVFSGIFGEDGFKINDLGMPVQDKANQVVTEILSDTQAAMLSAAQNIMNNPRVFEIRGRDVVNVGKTVENARLTIAGQTALERFNRDTSREEVQALVDAGTLENIFDPSVTENAIIFPKPLQDYIIKSYTQEGFYNDERQRYELLLGQRISVTSARTMEAPLPPRDDDQPLTALQKAQQSLSGTVARLERTDTDKFFGSSNQENRKREIAEAVGQPDSDFFIKDPALLEQFLDVLQDLPNVTPATLRMAITNITALEALPKPPEPAEAQVDPPKPEKIAPPQVDTRAGEVVAKGQAAVAEGAKAFIAGISRSPDLKRNQPTDLENLYNAAETQMKDRLSVVSTFGAIPARRGQEAIPGTTQSLEDFLKTAKPDVAITYIRNQIVSAGGTEAQIPRQRVTQDARTRLAKMLYQQYINSDYEIASPSQEGLAGVGIGGLMLPPAN
jgi:hypothetical protein